MKSGCMHVGTSGWTYDDWSGPFYPPAVKGTDRLGFYARRFDTVEVNASFYRTPSGPMIDACSHIYQGVSYTPFSTTITQRRTRPFFDNCWARMLDASGWG